MSRVLSMAAVGLSLSSLVVSGLLYRNARSLVDENRVVTARGLVIVDAHGQARAVLGAPVPDPYVRGVQARRSAPASGLVLIGPDGNERGGYLSVDVGGEAVLTLDSADASAEVFKVVANADAGASLFLQHAGGATAMLTTYRGEPELHLVGANGRSRFSRPENVELPR